MPTLVLLRHGQSDWNAKDLSTGWWDTDLSPLGEAEASAGGEELVRAGILPDVVHTSVLTRAVRTAELALHAAGRSWIPVHRSWRLNERHYGDLQGKNKAATKAEFGAEQFQRWRRSYDVPPPPIPAGSAYDVAGDPRYADLPPEVVPATECLADVVARMLPYWADGLVPDLRAGKVVLVVAHGNSLRALVKHLEHIADDAITGLEIPTGIPRVYDLGPDLRPAGPARELGDPAAIEARRAAVKAQGSTPPPEPERP